MVFSKQNDKLMASLAFKNNMDMDKVLSAYLITGNQFFMLLHALEGQTIKIPSKRRLTAANLNNIYFIEDDKREYADYERYDCIEKDGEMYSVISEEKRILNHYYIPVIRAEEVKDIE